MKIILEKNPNQFGADAISIDRLLTILQAYRNSSSLSLSHSPHFQATVNQWITYLTDTCNQLIGANLRANDPPLEFIFPFENEFMEFFGNDKHKVD